MTQTMTIDSRLGCSTISFRHWPLPGALAEIKAQGFGETDLGSLPESVITSRFRCPPATSTRLRNRSSTAE